MHGESLSNRAPGHSGPTRGVKVKQSFYRRVVFRRLFYLQLLRIVAVRSWAPAREGRIFVSLMGGIGDLVYLFPSLEVLADRYVVEMGTGGYPYRALVEQNPTIRRIWTPFIYKGKSGPRREAHQLLIKRVLGRFYEKVLLLDLPPEEWWKWGKHFARIYAEACGCPVPAKGRICLSDQNRRQAVHYLTGRGLGDFIYVAQIIRHRLPFRSWPLGHYHALYRSLRSRFDLPIIVDTVGSDERQIPDFCLDAGQLDILTAAAVIERARLFIGTDSGLTHVAGALGIPTVTIHLGYPPETCAALGERVTVVRQRRPFDEPANTSPNEVFSAVENTIPPTG